MAQPLELVGGLFVCLGLVVTTAAARSHEPLPQPDDEFQLTATNIHKFETEISQNTELAHEIEGHDTNDVTLFEAAEHSTDTDERCALVQHV
jgi:hypothetical protein